MKQKPRLFSLTGRPSGIMLAMVLLLTMLLVPAVNPCRENIYAAAPQYFTLNFKDVEITEFLNVMSQLLNKNILLDERVRGKLTISSPRRIPVTQAFDVMKSILEMKGLAVIETENLIKVIPMADAIKKNVEIIVDGHEQIDLGNEKTVTFLLDLKNAKAGEIINALNPLKSNFTTLVPYQALNMIIFSGNSTEIDGLIKIARALDRAPEINEDQPQASYGNIHVIHLQNARAEELGEVLARIPFSETALIKQQQAQTRPANSNTQTTGAQPATQTPPQKLSIVANKETNSLIITATPEEFKEISTLIKQLDIVRDQVLIEALIIEVSAENGWGFGIDWMLGNQSGSHIYGGSQILGTGPNYENTSGLDGKTLAVPLATGFQLGYLADKSILGFALLNASGSDNNFNILSTPQILTVDNQEAEINVGEQIPVPTNNRISDTGTQFYTYEYKDVGVKLKITPHITQGNQITLDLYQEVNSVLGDTTQVGSSFIPPQLAKRDIKTRITVYDGKTIVVGGLIRNNKTVTETKVPLLGDIPLLGWLFKRRTESYSKTNLLVFITPHIMTKKEQIDSITQQKMDEQKALREQ